MRLSFLLILSFASPVLDKRAVLQIRHSLPQLLLRVMTNRHWCAFPVCELYV